MTTLDEVMQHARDQLDEAIAFWMRKLASDYEAGAAVGAIDVDDIDDQLALARARLEAWKQHVLEDGRAQILADLARDD
jgi:hypothetical protein